MDGHRLNPILQAHLELTKSTLEQLLRPSQGFWGNRGEGYLFQENRGTKVKFWGEQGNKDNIGEQGTQENKFSIFGNKQIYFRGTRERVTPLPREGLVVWILTVWTATCQMLFKEFIKQKTTTEICRPIYAFNFKISKWYMISEFWNNFTTQKNTWQNIFSFTLNN